MVKVSLPTCGWEHKREEAEMRRLETMLLFLKYGPMKCVCVYGCVWVLDSYKSSHIILIAVIC